MLYHHDSRDYKEAASQAAKLCRDKLEEQIRQGTIKASAILEKVQAEQPHDVIRRGRELAPSWHVVPKDNGPSVVVLGPKPDSAANVHRHALQQACQRARMPFRYLDELLAKGEGWSAELAQKNLRELYQHNNDRLLIRSVKVGGELDSLLEKPRTGGNMPRVQVRGILSDRYRRLDSRPMFDAFAKAAAEIGLVPADGIGADTKWSVRALLPKVFEPVEHEIMAFGLELRNSDYGDGKIQLSMFCERLWCTNFATMKDELSKIHLGARLPDDLRLSQRTHDLDTEAFSSAIKDLTLASLSPDRVDATCEIIREASEQKLDWKQARRLLGTKLNKGETEKAETLFNDDHDQRHLPQGSKSKWRLSNVVSWLANSDGMAPDRKMELQTLAGDILN